MSNAYHTHYAIKDLLKFGDNRLKSIFAHNTGITAAEIRTEMLLQRQSGKVNYVMGRCKHKNADGSCAGHILPTIDKFLRDEEGYFIHPGVPDFNDNEDAISNWIYEQGLIVKIAFMLEDLPEDHPAFIDYINNSSAAVKKWEPDSPGESWFMLCLFDTEDGPVCWWVKHLEPFNVIEA